MLGKLSCFGILRCIFGQRQHRWRNERKAFKKGRIKGDIAKLIVHVYIG